MLIRVFSDVNAVTLNMPAWAGKMHLWLSSQRSSFLLGGGQVKWGGSIFSISTGIMMKTNTGKLSLQQSGGDQKITRYNEGGFPLVMYSWRLKRLFVMMRVLL